MAAQVIDAHEGPRLHSIDIEESMQMIDLMLQDAGMPALGLNSLRLTQLVPIFDDHLPRPFHQRAESGEAQAALEKLHLLVGLIDNAWVDENLKRNGLALAFRQPVGGD